MIIFLPNTNNICSVVIDKDTIRDYNSITLNEENNYTDYFINSHYLSKNGTELISIPPLCIVSTNLTTEVYYRNDFPQIVFTIAIMSIFIFLIPMKILFRLFRRLN